MAHNTNLEALVRIIVTEAIDLRLGLRTTKQAYRAVPHKTNHMLSWSNPVEIQTLSIPPFARVGAIGDGNCLLHSILFCLSSTYRRLNSPSRSFVADMWRNILNIRIDDLKEEANIVYFDIGGWEALEESFQRLPTKRLELDIEMAPLITRLYGHNCLAIQIRPSMVMVPVTLTFNSFQPERPTVLINYLGGSTNFGAAAGGAGGPAAKFYKSGHYEPIISAVFARKATSSSELRRRATAHAKKAPRVTAKRVKVPLYLLDATHTQYTLATDEVEPFLELFRSAAAVNSAYAHPLAF